MSSPDQTLQHAVHRLYDEHHDWLRAWLRKRMDCSESAADLAQDTFVRVLLTRKAFDLREPRAYLSSIARSLLIDRFRRRSLEQAYLETLANLPEPLELSPEARSMLLETLLEIDALLDGLGARTRQIFLMAQLDGLSFVDIARRLGLSVNTVRKHFVRAVAHCLLLIGD